MREIVSVKTPSKPGDPSYLRIASDRMGTRWVPGVNPRVLTQIHSIEDNGIKS